MFSTDKNIETIAQLIEAVKEYLDMEKEYIKLSVTEKLSRIVSAFMLFVALMFLLFFVMIFFGIALSLWLSPILGGYVCGFFVTGSLYAMLSVVIFRFRHRLLTKPVVAFLATLILSE